MFSFLNTILFRKQSADSKWQLLFVKMECYSATKQNTTTGNNAGENNTLRETSRTQRSCCIIQLMT